MENVQIERFIWSRTYILDHLRHKYNFNVVERNGTDIVFELRMKDNHQQFKGNVFVPEDDMYEVCFINWQGEWVPLFANTYMPRGLKGGRAEDGTPQILVGDEWVKYGKHREAMKKMDEKILQNITTNIV